MATRPWITPQEVIDYTEIAKVKARSTTKLTVDITRAEAYIIARFGQDFAGANALDGTPEYPTIPADVKTAAILIAEAIAFNASTDPEKTGLTGETFDDYSYSREAGVASIDLDTIDIVGLMSAYAKPRGSGNVTLKATAL